MGSTHRRARLIAYYLPQFHPIPENDKWWGNGFTEWTNVTKAKPLFRGHYQPHIPTELGFYDLRFPETRSAQAEMAREYGIHGFCYWHYWFAGKRLLERPFNEVLKSGEPDFPFCLAWANKSWSGIWHGNPGRILIEQTYPGMKEYEAHFYALLEALSDERYITMDGKPIFLVYDPYGLPEPKRFTDCWRELALKSGLNGLYFIGISDSSWHPAKHGFDAAVFDNPGRTFFKLRSRFRSFLEIGCDTLIKNKALIKRILHQPKIYSYKRVSEYALPPLRSDGTQYPSVIPNWDNTPRSGIRGVVCHNSSPELFRNHLREAIKQVADRKPDKRMIFVKSWNEWAEGNYLEPEQRFGKAYLKAIKEELF